MGISTDLIIAIVIFAGLVLMLWYFSRRALGGETERIERVREAAERGDVYSQFRLGQIYYEGKGVSRDDNEAAKWFLKAAGQDHSEAQFILATMYEKGTGLKRSDEEAFRWYLQAATQGHERASAVIEADKWTVFKKRHLAGDEIQPLKAMQDYQEQAPEHPGHGQEHHSPDLPSIGDDQIQKYFIKAQAGDVDAQYNLGIIYYHGEGAAKDYQEALKWFHLAAEQNDADAQYNLGFMYGRGEGSPKNHRQSMEWFQKAASQGHTGAREILEKMFRKT
ncbi:MAG: tetratricopeptide repeat protein [Desulfomonilia bacterium]